MGLFSHNVPLSCISPFSWRWGPRPPDRRGRISRHWFHTAGLSIVELVTMVGGAMLMLPLLHTDLTLRRRMEASCCSSTHSTCTLSFVGDSAHQASRGAGSRS